jgi:hypothetical protein
MLSLASDDGTRELRFGAARAGAKLAWPIGATVEFVVRMPGEHELVVLRGHHAIGSRAALDALVARATDLGRAPGAPIGLAAAQTAMSRDRGQLGRYASGDTHAVFADEPAGELTLCAIDAAAAPLCTFTTVAANPAARVSVLLVPNR